MKLRYYVLLLLFGIVFFWVLFPLRSVKTHAQIPPPTPSPFVRSIAFGAWTQGLYDAKSQTLHPEALTQFEALTNKKVSIAHYYLGWEYLANPLILSQFRQLRSHGWEPMLNVNPYYFSLCPASSLPLYRAIAKGDCDAFLHDAGKNVAHVNAPFYLLFAWEMNNKDNQWSIPYSGSTSEDFIAAWRHIHNIFIQEGATNVVWVFCPNVPDVASPSYRSLYPGDKYVDWIGLDGYNWGTTQSWSHWESFSDEFGSSYTALTTIAPDKPLMLAEVNATDQGGDKSSWYTDAFTNQIPYHFTKIDAVVLFNEDRSVQEHVNWNIDTSQASLQAFRKAISQSYYH